MRLVRRDCFSFLLPEIWAHLRKSHFSFDFRASVDYLHYVFFYQGKWSLATGTNFSCSIGAFAIGIRCIARLEDSD